MRFVIFASLVFIVAVLAGCNSKESALSQTQNPSVQNSPAPPQSSPADNARRITAEELYKLWEKGDVLIIDTRTEPSYKESHIKGAILIPAGDVLAKADELPRDKMIVAYCT